MYLKSLEIQGFKSFPEKTVLRFGDDITAIVGPNGSGKSNISDAIRWVMGEQSTKALRGAKMEDVIFGGTQKRGAVGFAEATLVLDNTDGALAYDAKEIAVTRRYYRSGDSEYYINRRSARLRDINELFMDTGLGREGYSNISQGRIDEILSLRSVDRREVFEEAAGISKFRHRKEETERRLANTQDNLVRIGDKISELELQVEPLRVQAEKARKYLAWRSELKGLEVAVWLEALERLAAAAQKADEDYRSAKFILDQSHEDLDRLYALSESLAENLHTRDLALEKLREEIGAAQASIREIEGRIAVLQTNLRNNQTNIERMQLELQDADSRGAAIRTQIVQHETRIAEIDGESGELNAQILAKQDESRSFAASADELTKSYVHWSETQASVQEDLADKRAQSAAIEQSEQLSVSRAEELNAQTELARARLSDVEADVSRCEKALEQAREEASGLENTIAGYQLRLESRREKRDALRADCARLEIDLQTAERQQAMYREMERAYEGYSKAVKHTMQQARAGLLAGIRGPISSLIHTDDDYTVAIETAMGAAMQYIVVADERAGKAAIENLKAADKGRNTFYPMTTMRGRPMHEPGLEDDPGFVGVASELVRCAEEYRQIIDHILGRTAVAERLDDAIRISKKYPRKFRIVTLDGQVVNADSSMTGGSVIRNSGILSRANAIARLETQIRDMRARLSEARKSLQNAESETAKVEYELDGANGELRQAQDAVLRIEGELRQHEVLRDAVTEAIRGNEQELAALAERSRLDHDRAVTLAAQTAMLEKRLDETSAKLSEISVSQNEALEKVRALSDEITRLKVRTAALEAERQSSVVARDHLRELGSSMQGDLNQKQALIDRMIAHNDDIEADISKQTAGKDDLAVGLEEKTEQLQRAAQERIDTEAKKTKAERDAQDKSKEILNMEREAARLEQRKNAAGLEEKQIVDRLWDTYELTRTAAAEAAAPIESVAGAQRSITDLKRKISSLGEPNPGAIEQFELVNERYQYLCAQRDDVLQAKQELEGVIDSITGQMVEIFTAEFAKMGQYFSQTFVEMFGGGKGALVLEDPSQPLTCGIEIRVQPPGKQLKTITLLSGGEKAFVAIALYFAILKVRPTPFCMLDEIDAALDDRNVDRFAGYLRTLCKKTQFIVITHRRGTMEQADILYGVTMQEQGVSKIIQLDLKQIADTLGITE